MRRPSVVVGAVSLGLLFGLTACAEPYVHDVAGASEATEPEQAGVGSESDSGPSPESVGGASEVAQLGRADIEYVRDTGERFGDFYYQKTIDGSDVTEAGGPVMHIYVTDQFKKHLEPGQWTEPGPQVIVNGTTPVSEKAVAAVGQTAVGTQLAKDLGTEVVAEWDPDDPRIFGAAVKVGDGYVEFLGQDLESEEQLQVFIKEFLDAT